MPPKILTVPDHVTRGIEDRVAALFPNDTHSAAERDFITRQLIESWAEGYACAQSDALAKRPQPTSTETDG